MKNLLVWILVYTGLLATSQVFLKWGVGHLGGIKLKSIADVLPLIIKILTDPLIIVGTLMMLATYFVWIFILSWFDLGMAFPLTALTYVFVAILAFVLLGERMTLQNYAGIFLIAGGVFFLLYK
ncbi:MAG: EamA family transporter [Candidatus Margulisiibacteriota bacterium]